MTSKDDIYQEYVDALQEQQEALDQLHQLQDTYTPVQRVQPGQRIVGGAPITEDVLITIKAAQDRVDAALGRARRAQLDYMHSLQQ